MNRLTLITGACGGIGRSLCQYFIEQGDRVIALDRDAAALASLQVELGSACLTVAADLTDADAVQQALAPLLQAHGPVQVLIANAGAAAATTLQHTTPALWQQDIALNLNGTYHSVEAVRPGMMQQGKGAIVLIGSVNGMAALGHPAYSAAKAGLISYTRALALEYGRHGIRANIVCPGTVKTPAWQARVDKNPQVFEHLKKWYPLGDFATPLDIAKAAWFLASDDARMISGVSLPVDGGLMAGNRVMAEELTLEAF